MVPALCAAVLLAAAAPALAQERFPAKPLRMVVPFVPGGVSELLSRALAKQLSESLGQQVLIENIGGAGSTLGTAAVAKAEPDGHTLLFGYSSGLAIAPGLYPKLPYDPITSFTHIGTIARFYLVMTAHADVPAANLRQLVAHAKANPGKLSYATSGVGSTLHLVGEILRSKAGIDIVHVPYKGMRPAITDYVAGRVHLAWDAVDNLMPHIKGGKIKPIAVTSPRRMAEFPDTPTVLEAGYPDLGVFVWTALLAPAGVPPAIAARLETALSRALDSREIQQVFTSHYYEVFPGNGRSLEALLRQDVPRWTEVIRAAGAKAE